MSKIISGTLIVVSAIALALLAAFGISAWGSRTVTPYANGFWRGGMMNGGGMGFYNQPSYGNRLTIDQAASMAENYVSSISSDLVVDEVMSFQGNFYIAVVERNSQKAAFELLMDPQTGNFRPEPGPNMMWNQKYGRMRFWGNGAVENSITNEQARELAQEALTDSIPGAIVEPDGYDFNGYYTFDYKVNGVISGMLSINGFNGQVWFHTWHGNFIEEKEVNE
jgi:hypothetical protein